MWGRAARRLFVALKLTSFFVDASSLPGAEVDLTKEIASAFSTIQDAKKEPPRNAGIDCLEACGNRSGWCSYCGVGKACCPRLVTTEPPTEECLDLPLFADGLSHECTRPNPGALETLGIAELRFVLEQFSYVGAVSASWITDGIKSLLQDKIKDVLLNIIPKRYISIDIIRGPSGWAFFQVLVMLPRESPATERLAESRLCDAARRDRSFALSVTHFPGATAALKHTMNVQVVDEAIDGHHDCPEEDSPSSASNVSDTNAEPWWSYFFLGTATGMLSTALFLGLCFQFCRSKSKGAALKLPLGSPSSSFRRSFSPLSNPEHLQEQMPMLSELQKAQGHFLPGLDHIHSLHSNEHKRQHREVLLSSSSEVRILASPPTSLTPGHSTTSLPTSATVPGHLAHLLSVRAESGLSAGGGHGPGANGVATSASSAQGFRSLIGPPGSGQQSAHQYHVPSGLRSQ